MFEFCICAVVPKLPGFLKFKGECIFAKQIGCIQMQCNFSPSPPRTAWFSSSLGSPVAPWSLGAQRGCAGWRPPLAFTLCENQSLSEACASVYRDSGTATSSVDWAAWSTAPGSATVGCGSTATQWVGVHAPPRLPVALSRSCLVCLHFLSGGPGQSHRRVGQEGVGGAKMRWNLKSHPFLENLAQCGFKGACDIQGLPVRT